MKTVSIQAQYYRQYDADLGRDVPGEGYGGWQQAPVEINPDRTALVVMHAWAAGTPAAYPGWYRAVEYIPRSQAICRDVFPRLLGTVRKQGWNVFHVVGGGDYYRKCPGYARACGLAGPPPPPRVPAELDPALEALRQFKHRHVFPGAHNQEDITRGFRVLDFAEHSEPVGDEGVAENGHQLAALCRHHGVNHLVYAGFAINWCLLMSPGGMQEMSQYGMMCSAIRQAVTAVENRESARQELHKEEGLWRVSIAFGFVFDLDGFLRAVESCPRQS